MYVVLSVLKLILSKLNVLEMQVVYYTTGRYLKSNISNSFVIFEVEKLPTQSNGQFLFGRNRLE